MLEVQEAGTLASIQDAGRPGFVDLGVPIGGACDPRSLAIANVLLGNVPAAPAVEVTLAGFALVVLRTCTVAIAGADLGARVPEELRTLLPGHVHLLRAGTHLRFERRLKGARAYLALAGGIAVPPVLGSAATCLAGGFGGIEGRPLRHGDRLIPSRPDTLERAGRAWPDDEPALGQTKEGQGGKRTDDELEDASAGGRAVRLRVVEGPGSRLLPGTLEALCARTWETAPEGDRTGLRLLGPQLPPGDGGGALVSTGMLWGAVQVPPDGSPIVLLADAPPVGGYPVPAVVIRADLPLLGQLAPGDRLSFVAVGIDEAQMSYRAQRVAFERAAARLPAADAWDELDFGAGG